MAGTPQVRAVLQAGGKGTRMQGASEAVPKPLLRIGGTPMLERLLRQVIDAGVHCVTIVTGWLGERVERHVLGLDGLPPDMDLSFVRESEPRGNAGSLADLPRDGKSVMLCFGDLVTDLDFARLIEIHVSRGAAVTLTSHYETHRLRLGELRVEGERVLGYSEKPEKRFLICSGIAVLEPAVLDLIPRDRPVGLVDLMVSALARGLEITHWTHGASWMDVNSPEELELAGSTQIVKAGP